VTDLAGPLAPSSLLAASSFSSSLFALKGVTARVAVRTAWVVVIVIVTLVVTRGVRKLVRRLMHGVLSRAARLSDRPRAAGRAKTLANITGQVTAGIVWVIGVLTALGTAGLDLTPLLAGATVIGAALGFGAQTLVKDFLSGFLILAEDQYGIGDTIAVDTVTGVVEDVRLRVTRLRAADGTVYYVPNGDIRLVANTSLGWRVATVDLPLAGLEQLGAALAAVEAELDAWAGAPEQGERMLAPPEVAGLEDAHADLATLRVTVRVTPPAVVPVTRQLRRLLSERLARDGLLGAWAAGSSGPGTTARP
jgi:small conductance mechanosensitive channel